jgi:hypothetical protein
MRLVDGKEKGAFRTTKLPLGNMAHACLLNTDMKIRCIGALSPTALSDMLPSNRVKLATKSRAAITVINISNNVTNCSGEGNIANSRRKLCNPLHITPSLKQLQTIRSQR